MTNPRSIPKANWPWLPPGHTTSGAVRTVISALVASHLAQLDHQVKGVVNGSFTAKGLADIGVEGNDICTGVAAQGGKAEKSKSKGKGQKCEAFGGGGHTLHPRTPSPRPLSPKGARGGVNLNL